MFLFWRTKHYSPKTVSKQALLFLQTKFYVWFPENLKENARERKYKGKKKNAKENDFLMFGCPMKNIKENQIWLKLIKNLCIFKLFNPYIDKLK